MKNALVFALFFFLYIFADWYIRRWLDRKYGA